MTRQVHEQVQANAAVSDGSVDDVDTDRIGAIFGPANRRKFASRDILFTVTDQRGVVVGAPGPASEQLVSLRGDQGVDAASGDFSPSPHPAGEKHTEPAAPGQSA